MSELVIRPKSSTKVSYNGKEYVCNRPPLSRASRFQDDMDKAKKNGAKAVYNVMKEFLIELGLVAEVVDDLDSDQMEDVIAALASKKKS